MDIKESKPNELLKAVYEGQQNPIWGTEHRRYPACSLTCNCFEIGIAHKSEEVRKYCDQLIIAIRLICDERKIPQSNKNLNALIGEIHGQWVKDIEEAKRRAVA